MSPFRDRVFQADSFENNEDKIPQPTPNSSPSPETLDASKDIVGPKAQPNNELNKSQDESGETDSELNLEFLYKGTADVDICAEELNKIETGDLLENVWEPASVEENETAEKELDPITLSSYHGLADVDVCSEELQSTLQEEQHTEGSRNMTVTDAGFIPPSESPGPVLVEQDVQDTHDGFTLFGTETSVYVEQDADKELDEISYNDKTTSFLKEDEIGETGHVSEDVGEMSNTLFDEPGPEIHHVEQLQLNERAESISVSEEATTFDETNTNEIPLEVENQQLSDILAAEAMSESSFVLEKVSLADRTNEDKPGMEEFTNVASEVQEENKDVPESVTDVIDTTDERDSQTGMQEDETNDDQQTDSQDIFEAIPVDDMEGLVDSNLNPTGFLDEDVTKDGTRTSQQDVHELEDTNEIDEGNNDVNAPETQDDHLFYNTFTHESKRTHPPSEETEQDMEVTDKQSASESQEHREEPETAVYSDQSEHKEDMVHESVLESENKEVDLVEQVRRRNSVLFEFGFYFFIFGKQRIQDK